VTNEIAPAVINGLKDFQRRTVEHAFHRLYKADDSTQRFLVADEVGTGKTMVAKGVIAKAIDHLQTEKDVQRIDIIYICSNSAIANISIYFVWFTEFCNVEIPISLDVKAKKTFQTGLPIGVTLEQH